MKNLKKANISNKDIIGILRSDQLYNNSKIIRKWNNLFTNKGFQFSNIRKNSNLTKIEEDIVRRNIYYYMK